MKHIFLQRKRILSAYPLAISLIALVLFTSFNVWGQSQRNLFFNSFANVVRLDFATEPPIPYGTGVAGSYEGIAHYEDGSGNLLFWFNSTGVFDQNGTLMPGSFGILANSSSAEMCVAPVPGNPNQYYFLYNAETCSALYYAIVDMSLNGGLGNVIAVNTLISNAQHSEGMEVVRIPGTNNFWFLTYRCGTGFTRYLISETGIGTGTVFHPYPMPTGGYDGRGNFDYHQGRIGAAFAWSSQVFVADFDPVNGVVCNPVTLNSDQFSNNPFGVEFSPDGSKMYFSLWYTTGQPNVFQYNIETGVFTGYLPPLGGGGFISGLGEIEMGRNGKLYIIQDGGNNITVINNPNDNIPNFGLIPIPAATGLGISDHIQSDVFDSGINYTDTLCATVGSTLILQPAVDAEYEWTASTDPGTVISIGSSLSVTADDVFTTYTATGVGGTTCFAIFNQYAWSVFPQPDVDAGPDKTIQVGQSTTLDGSTGVQDATFVLWFPATGLSDPFSITPTANPTQTTTYTLTVQNGPCQGFDQVTVTVLPVSVQENICALVGDQLTLTAPDTLTNVQWYEAGNQATILGTGNTYTPTAMGTTQITYVASGVGPNTPAGALYAVTLVPQPKLTAGNNVTIFAGESVTLNAGGADQSGYVWAFDASLSALNIPNPVATPTVTTTYFVSSAFDPACPAQASVTVTVLNQNTIADTLCALVGSQINLSAPGSFTSVEWVDAANPTQALGSGASFSATATNSEVTFIGRATDDQGNITDFYYTLLPNPPIDAGPDRVILEGSSHTFNITGGANLQWQPAQLFADPTSANPTVTPMETTTFTVTNTTDKGCQFTDEVTITVKSESYMLIPSAFSPNNDGVNDELRIVPFNVTELVTFVVYNRWGNKVFETNNINEGWNGKYKGSLQEVGTYVYYATAISKDGVEYTQKGNTLLMR
ncbi:MAG TPA: gliding motility-associated C-terminal domain-containing protein [Chitinophagales bacterium]|nr:gliding motility-associated C-terminal domain-containing protein [Chitinophagales bacterium]HRK27904.1 gliding motility-associated C-terminal domain-containing protein [Chitinophagales bacterium]